MRPKLAIMTLDPGKTSGQTRGFYNLRRGETVRGTLKRALEKGAVDFKDVIGEPERQANEIVCDYWNFRHHAVSDLGLKLDCVVFVIESFALRQRSVELQPVEVNAGIRSLLLGVSVDDSGAWTPHLGRGLAEVEYQTPSTAKGFATNARLRKWNVWVPGDHRRDAWRHTAAYISRELDR